MDSGFFLNVGALVAGVLLSALSNWVYDLLRQRGLFPDKPSIKRVVLTAIVFLPLVVVVILPQIINSESSNCQIKINNLTIEQLLVETGQSTSVEVVVTNPKELPLVYNWDATGGEMSPGLRSSSFQSVYTSPLSPIDDTISVEITSPNCDPVRASKQVSVVLPSAVLEATATLPTLATPEATETTEVTLTPKPTLTPNETEEVIPGWKKFATDEFSVWLPEEFEGGDLEKDLELILDRLRKLGPSFEQMAQQIESYPEVFLLWAFDTANIGEQGQLSNILVGKESVLTTLNIQKYLELLISQLPAEYEVREQETTPYEPGYPARRLVLEANIGGVEAISIIYIIQQGNSFWTVNYSTSQEEYTARLPNFEKSFGTFRILVEE